MTVLENTVVAIEYELRNAQGHKLDSNKGFAPLEYLHGAGNIVMGLEKALHGLGINENIKVTVPPELGYGLYENNLIYHLPLADFSLTGFTDIEDVIHLADGREAVIVAKQENTITADANHPLAGQVLYYDITIKHVRQATKEEIVCGQPLSEAKYCSGMPGCC